MANCKEEVIVVKEKISRWTKFKGFNKRNKLPLIMVAFNIAIFCLGVYILCTFLKNRDSLVQNVANAGSISYASSFASQINMSLSAKQELLENIANKIESNNKGVDGALESIIINNIENDDLLLIKVAGYTGYEITSNDILVKPEEESFYEDEALVEFLNTLDWNSSSDETLNVSTEYWDEATEQYDVIVYYPVKIANMRYYLLNFVPLKKLVQDNYMNSLLFSKDHTVIINKAGDLLFGSIFDLSIKDDTAFIDTINKINQSVKENINESSDNLLEKSDAKVVVHENLKEFIDKVGSEDLENLYERLQTNENGFFIATEGSSDSTQYVYTYYFMGDPFDWIFINRIENEIMSSGGEVLRFLFLTLGLLSAFLVVNMSIIIMQNIRLKRTLVKIEEQNVELEKANKAQQTFISSMSHEIRTPINAVLGMDEMIIRETTEEDIKKYAYDIKSAGRSLLSIVNDILDFTKIQSGKMDIIPQDYELSSLVNDLINLVDVRMKNKNLDFIVNVNPDIPHLMFGDDIRIKQIIQNILTNAAKYTEKGSVTFSIDFEKKDDNNVILKVAVKDTGIGIKPEEMEKLTKPFERLDEKKTRTIEGTGLGMSITTNLLNAMNSKLEVESVYGEGSNFHFELEQRVVDWKGIGPLDRSFVDSREEKENEGILHARRAKLLVVDDTTMNLTVVVGLLKRTGVQIDTAESGRACLELCKNKKYDIIFLDHRMPEMDGVECLEHLKQEEGLNKETTVIALTANAMSGAYEEYIRYGFNDFLAKPVNGNKLERMILKYLDESLLDTADDLELDDNAGIKACGTAETVLQVRTEFLQTGDKTRKEIATYLENGDIKNYTIKVHALKSTARLIGATSLSSEALYLENCGNEGRHEEILQKTGELLKHHEKICEILKAQIGEDDESKEEISPEFLKEGLEAILEFTLAFDFDQVDNIISEFNNYQMPIAFRDTYEELKSAIYDVDQEKIEKIILERIGRDGK